MVAAALAVLAASTLPMVMTDYRMQIRRTMEISAHHLAESGIERALWILSQSTRKEDLEADGWTLDAHSDDFYHRDIPLSAFGSDSLENLTPNLRVVFENPAGESSIRVISIARVSNPAAGEHATRRIVVEVAITASGVRSSPFIGLVTNAGIRFNNENFFDSYDSSVFPYRYAPENKGYNINLATTRTGAEAIQLGRSTVHGNLLLPTKNPQAVQGHGYRVSGETRTDFDFEFTPVSPPNTDGWASDFGPDNVIGTPGATEPERYVLPHGMQLSQDLIINGPVEIVVSGDLNPNGHDIKLKEGSGSLTLYAGSNINMHGGARFINPNVPANLMIIGTSTSQWGQDFVVTDWTDFTGVVYAPNAHVMFNGGNGATAPSYSGGISAKNVTFNAQNVSFHFDESLRDLTLTVNGFQSQSRSFTVKSYAIVDRADETIEIGGSEEALDAFVDGLFGT